jgi:hypothetical protein
VNDLVKAMGMSGVFKSEVSRLCAEIDERVHAFLDHPMEGDWPFVWLDATTIKMRRAGRIVSVAAIIGVGVNVERLRQRDDDGRIERTLHSSLRRRRHLQDRKQSRQLLASGDRPIRRRCR